MFDNNASASVSLNNLFEFFELFECDYKCTELLQRIRWRNGFVCPKCRSGKAYRIREYRVVQCAKCRHQISATSGTIFHRSHVALRKWFVAIMLLLSDKSGLSAQRLHLVIDVSYKTALNMLKKLRALMGIQNEAQCGEFEFSYLLNLLKAKAKKPIKAIFQLQCKPETLEQETPSSNVSDRVEELHGQEHFKKPISPIAIKDPSLSGDKHPPARAEKLSSKAERIPSKSEQMRIAGAVSLTKQYFLGSFHRASSTYLQLYFDEYVYRYGESNVLNLILKFLGECCQSSSKQVFQYLKTIIKRHGSRYKLDGGAENLSEPVDSSYLGHSLRAEDWILNCA